MEWTIECSDACMAEWLSVPRWSVFFLLLLLAFEKSFCCRLYFSVNKSLFLSLSLNCLIYYTNEKYAGFICMQGKRKRDHLFIHSIYYHLYFYFYASVSNKNWREKVNDDDDEHQREYFHHILTLSKQKSISYGNFHPSMFIFRKNLRRCNRIFVFFVSERAKKGDLFLKGWKRFFLKEFFT